MLKFGVAILVLFICCNSLFAQIGSGLTWVVQLQDQYIPIGKASGNHIAMRENKQVYLFNLNGENIPLDLDSISHKHGSFWTTWLNGLSGMYMADRGQLLPPAYHQVNPALETGDTWAFEVTKYGMHAIVNDRNELLLPYQAPKYVKLHAVGDTILGYQKRPYFKHVVADIFYISKQGYEVSEAVAKRIAPPEFQRISANAYVIDIHADNQISRDTFAHAESFISDIAVVKDGEAWGYFQRNGDWLLPPQYQAAMPFDERGLAVVKARDKYGVINKRGEYEIEPDFEFLKPSLGGLYEFKSLGRIGLIDAEGDTVLAPGSFRGIRPAGKDCFAILSGDSLLIYNQEGSPLQVSGILDCSSNMHGENFWVKKSLESPTRRRSASTWGVLAPDGTWVIMPTARGNFVETGHFYLVEAISEPCCTIGNVNIGSNKKGKYLIFDHQGKPLLENPVDSLPVVAHPAVLIYTQEGKFGLITKEGDQSPAEYDDIHAMGNGWIAVRKGNSWGILKR